MSKIVSVIKGVRRHWKKSLFGICALGYAGHYLNVELSNRELMRIYCEAAAKYGDVKVSPTEPPYNVVVILNPAANRRKSKKMYEKYCAPIFHLGGLYITVLTTTPETNARQLVQSLPQNTNAIVIAGGDGTVSEVVTGLLRKMEEAVSTVRNIPLGILPLGQNNFLAKRLYQESKNLIPPEQVSNFSVPVQYMVECAFMVLSNKTKNVDIMKIENTEVESTYRPVYGLNEVNWGCLRDAFARRNKYWIFGKWRLLASHVFGSYNLEKPVTATLHCAPPCDGCKYCYKSRVDLAEVPNNSYHSTKKWWQVWVQNKTPASTKEIDYENIENKSCLQPFQQSVETVSLRIFPSKTDSVSSLTVAAGPSRLSYTEFVKNGWLVQNEGNMVISENQLNAREVSIEPTSQEKSKDQQLMLSIDGEDYEVTPLKVMLLNKMITVFCGTEEMLS